MQGLSEGRSASKRRDQSLWTSIRRFWYVVLGSGVVALILGGTYGFVNPSEPVYGADVTIVVQDPATAVAGGTTTARFVASQAELLRSDIVASAAAQDLAQLDPPVVVEPFDLIASTTVTFSGDSSILVVEFVDSDPDMAVLKANAITDVFNQVSRLQVTGFSENALARIDAQLEAFNQRQAEIAAELDATREENVGLATLERQHAEAIIQIGALQEERKTTTSVERLDAIRIAIDDLRTQIDVYQQALDAQDVSPLLRSLNEEQDLIIARRAEVLTQRDQISIEAELAPGAVVSLPSRTSKRCVSQPGYQSDSCDCAGPWPRGSAPAVAHILSPGCGPSGPGPNPKRSSGLRSWPTSRTSPRRESTRACLCAMLPGQRPPKPFDLRRRRLKCDAVPGRQGGHGGVLHPRPWQVDLPDQHGFGLRSPGSFGTRDRLRFRQSGFIQSPARRERLIRRPASPMSSTSDGRWRSSIQKIALGNGVSMDLLSRAACPQSPPTPFGRTAPGSSSRLSAAHTT